MGRRGGGDKAHGLNYPPNQPLYQQQQINVCQLSKQIGFATGKNLQETVYPLLEQRSAVICKFLDYICARVEGKGDPVFEGSSGLCFWMARGHARLTAELSPAGAGVEGCVTGRLKGLHSKPEGL